MKNLNSVAGDITKGKNLNENIIKFGNSLSTMYCGLAYIKLSMNYYTFEEMYNECDFTKNGSMEKLKELTKKVVSIIEKTINDDSFAEITELDKIRCEIIKEMELVTGIVDKLRIYEYILNRVEYRFDDGDFDEEYYNSRLTNDLMHYILSDKDNVVINGKIAEVVTQLPMRLTKNSFLEHLKDAFTLYKGAYVKTVKDFVYNLSTVALLDELKDSEKEFEQVSVILKELERADFKNITNDEYQRLSQLLTISAKEMEDAADIYLMLAMAVNDLYSVLLTKGSAFNDVEEIVKAKKILAKISESIIDGSEPANDEVVDTFTSFEGKQEKLLMSVDSCDYAVEYVLNNCKQKLEETQMADVYSSLKKILKLQSGSTFVSLSEDEEDEIITDDALSEEYDRLAASLLESFKEHSQQVNRAVMANVLGQLPVFFNSVDEIQGYINVSLSQCADISERRACVEIMNMIMENR